MLKKNDVHDAIVFKLSYLRSHAFSLGWACDSLTIAFVAHWFDLGFDDDFALILTMFRATKKNECN